MRHLFLDTNVVIDFLIRRGEFATAAADLFQAAVEGRVALYVASLSFNNIYYTLRKDNTPGERIDKLTKLTKLVQIVAVDAQVVQQALAAGFADFEDAIQHFAATSVPAIEAIVTRDPKGFRGSALQILTPAEAGAQML